MATTCQLVGWMADGVIDAAGANLASGVVRFYDVGTTNLQTVYSDPAASTAYTQPITLDAYGRKTVYVKQLCRVVVKDATDTTTLYDFDPLNSTRAEQVSITNSVVNGGVEITLNAWLTAIGNSTSLYQAISTATPRSVNSWLRESHIYPTDFGATGLGVVDDTTAIQSAIAAALASDRAVSTTMQGRVFVLPAGTWLISSALTMTVASGNTPIILRGQGSKLTIIKQSSTSANGLTINWSVGSTDAKVTIEDIGFTCSTTSSGTAISVTNANNTAIRDCASSLFRTGFSVASASGCHVDRCHVISTDGNAAAAGIVLGAETTVSDCLLAGSSSLGTGVSGVGTNSDIRGCKISGFDKGVNVTGADVRIQGGQVSGVTAAIQLQGNDSLIDGTKIVTGATTGVILDGTDSKIVNARIVAGTLGVDMNGAGNAAVHCRISGATTGIDMGANECTADHVSISAATTGVNVGAFTECGISFCRFATVTTQIAVNASAEATLQEWGNDSADSNAQVTGGRRQLWTVATTTFNTNTNVTPGYEGNGVKINRYRSTGGAGLTLTINATATTGLRGGDVMAIQVIRGNGAGGTITMTFNAQYLDSSQLNTFNPTAIPNTFDASTTFWFYWVTATSSWVSFSAAVNDF